MSANDSTSRKQPYSSPKLVTYGDIAQLTQATATAKQKADGGGKLKTKTV